ncbi:MAG: NAD-dependent epimerase/dehydratase family protein [Sulfobacillus sp.]
MARFSSGKKRVSHNIMRVFIAGVDGYLGWNLAQYLVARGHRIGGMDNLARRRWVSEVGGESAFPLAGFRERVELLCASGNADPQDFIEGDLCDFSLLRDTLRRFSPQSIVHLGQMPSAPFSMKSRGHCVACQVDNLTSNLNLLWAIREVCPDCHLVKLGSMGEYGQPNVEIPEGSFRVEFRGRTDELPFPRQPGSFYHLSKVHDSHNTAFACKVWGLRATDVMQGIVCGTRFPGKSDDPRLASRLDFDECFGTVLNRFCVQAVLGMPLTVYGGGSMIRSYLSLADSLQCLALIVENPVSDALAGTYRVINQFAVTASVAELAETVSAVCREEFGLAVEAIHCENPRNDREEHFYRPENRRLFDLGYRPTTDLRCVIRETIADLLPHRDRLRRYREAIAPKTKWDDRAPVGISDRN